MYQYRIRIRNRILQKLYKPMRKNRFITGRALSALDEIDRRIEETITPLLSELF
ncbi:MAG: hypothetical protein FWC77_06220 [Defluviitaleaceae bacterium]|nr:hypothetical protein [Defluviitaleaceae bacterium]